MVHCGMVVIVSKYSTFLEWTSSPSTQTSKYPVIPGEAAPVCSRHGIT
jgi:hypothetical protein